MANELMTLPEKISNELLPLREEALSLVIKTPEDKQTAGKMIIAAGEWSKLVVAYFAPMKKAAHETHKAITTRETEQISRAKEISNILSPKLSAYTVEEERLRALSEAKAIDQYHINVKKAGLKAEELCKAGKQEQAAELLAHVKSVTPTAPEPVKVDGLAMVEDYEVTITNADLVPREYCVPDAALIKRDIKNWNGKKQIPGVTFVKTLKPRRIGRQPNTTERW